MVIFNSYFDNQRVIDLLYLGDGDSLGFVVQWQAWWFCGLHPCHERWMWPAKRWGCCEDETCFPWKWWYFRWLEVNIFQKPIDIHKSHKSRDVASRMGSDWLFGMAASAQPSQKRWRWMASKQGRRDLYKGIGRERERARLTCKMQWSYWGFWAGRWLGLWQSTGFVCVAWSMLHPGSLGHPRIDIATAILGTCPNNYTLLGYLFLLIQIIFTSNGFLSICPFLYLEVS